MKKTLMALAITGMSQSAIASITVYDGHGVIVDVTGSAEVQVYKGYGPSDTDVDIRLDDGDVGVATSLELNSDWSAIGAFAYAFEDSDIVNDELYVGLSSKTFGTLTIGRQYLLSDDTGIGKDYEFGTGGVDFVQTQGDEVYKYIYDNGAFYFGTSGLLANDGSTYLPNTDQDVDFNRAGETEAYDGRIGFRYEGLDARAYYYTARNAATAGLFRFGSEGDNPVAVNVDAYSLEAEYQMTEAIGLAASFSNFEYEHPEDASQKQEADVWQIAADYQWNNTNFAIGYNYWNDTKNTVAGNEDEVDAMSYYFNVTQRIHKFASVYAEVGYVDEDGDQAPTEDVAYLVGMEISF